MGSPVILKASTSIARAPKPTRWRRSAWFTVSARLCQQDSVQRCQEIGGSIHQGSVEVEDEGGREGRIHQAVNPQVASLWQYAVAKRHFTGISDPAIAVVVHGQRLRAEASYGVEESGDHSRGGHGHADEIRDA